MLYNSNDIKILKNVLTLDECKILNRWAVENYNQDVFKNANLELSINRKTTRNSNQKYYDFPDIVYDKFENIKTELGLDKFEYHYNGKDGIVCTVSESGSYLKEHIDPKMENSESYHLLIKTSKDEPGGNLVFNNVEHEIKQGDCLCFFSSIHKHSLTTYEGLDLRITWFCSIQIPKELINYENTIIM